MGGGDGASAAPSPPAPLRILICGFGPFPGVAVNPSTRFALAVARYRRPALANVQIHVEILPTHWDALDRLDAVATRFAPDAILLMGVAARRRAVCVERLAVNAADARPDAVHRHAPGRKVLAGARPALSSTADVRRLAAALRRFGVASRLSRNAGRYLCNASYFRALAAARAREASPIPVVFIHLPRRDGTPRGISATRLRDALSATLVELAAQAKTARQKRRT